MHVGDTRRRMTRWEVAAVVSAVVGVMAPSFVSTEWFDSAWSSLPAGLLVIGAAVAVVAGIRFPRRAAAAAIAIFAVGCAVDGAAVSYLIAVLVTLFSVATQTDRRSSILMGIAAAATAAPSMYFLLEGDWNDLRAVLQVGAFIGFAVAAGDATRSRRAVIESLEERTRRAEESADSEARRRVAEERVRIARDLHDVMAHQIAIINLHASVASGAVRNGSAGAESSLATIRDAARTVLTEIGSLLTVLRAGDEQTSTHPAPGMGEIDDLVREFTASGLSLRVRNSGERMPLSAASDVVAYRVIQEALTNAQKHGNGSSALLDLEWRPDGVEVTVTNGVRVPSRRSAGTGAERPARGHGLVGVRERVQSIGGTSEVRSGPGPVHRFEAWIPSALSAGDHPEASGSTWREGDR
ncbi:MAG: hypothetical protein RI885_1453 [Actinomycetota bacterium]